MIVGRSYIGLEFGQMFKRLAAKITIIEQGQHIIGREDDETSEMVQGALEADGVVFQFGGRVYLRFAK